MNGSGTVPAGSPVPASMPLISDKRDFQVSETMNDEVRKVHVVDQTGTSHEIDGLDGWRVMEIIRDNGVPIKAECGGACACATCHVYVEAAWLDKLVPATGEEIERLDEAFEVKANSRLSCQILMRPDLDGLRLRLAPGTEP